MKHLSCKTIFCLSLIINVVISDNKYSRDANEKKKKDVDFRTLEKPFRMNKLNILWTKAQQVFLNKIDLSRLDDAIYSLSFC